MKNWGYILIQINSEDYAKPNVAGKIEHCMVFESSYYLRKFILSRYFNELSAKDAARISLSELKMRLGQAIVLTRDQFYRELYKKDHPHYDEILKARNTLGSA